MNARRHFPSRRVLAPVAVALAIGLAWQVGRLQGAGSLAVPTAGTAGAPTASDGAVGSDPGAGELAARLVAERDSALAEAESLGRRLAEAERRKADDTAALELYRRIESGGVAAGLGVDKVALKAAGTPDALLEITLVQSRGRKRIAGSLGVSAVSTGVGANDAREIVPAAGPGSLPFDLRFFQTLRIRLGEQGIGDLDPASAALRIEVRPTGVRQPPIVEVRHWDTIVE